MISVEFDARSKNLFSFMPRGVSVNQSSASKHGAEYLGRSLMVHPIDLQQIYVKLYNEGYITPY